MSAAATGRDGSAQQRCLVTGATGFIGGCLTRRLAGEGRAVRCLVRASSDTSHLSGLGVQIAVGDLTDAASLRRAVEGCDHVFHCAALVSDWATNEETVRANVVGTRNLLQACADARVARFVHLSTTDVYGHPDGACVKESHGQTGFSNWYARTKRDAEAEVRHASQAHGIDAVVLRPATVYGPGSADVIGQIAQAIRGRNMVLIGGGRTIAGLCYVENLVDAAVLAAHRDAAVGRAINVTDGLGTTWCQFTDDLAAALDCPPVRWSMPYWLAYGIGFALEHGYRALRRAVGLSSAPLLSRQAVQVLGRNQDFSNRMARELLGWEPRVDYSAGMAATVAWLRSDFLRHA